MRIYTAHLRPGRDPVLVREGWSWPAFWLGPLWLLGQRAWIAAVLDLACFALLFAAAPPRLHGPGALGLALLAGLLGRDLVRWSLDRRGFALAHVLAAPDHDAALARLYAARADLAGQAR